MVWALIQGPLVEVELRYRKLFWDNYSKQTGYATTWETKVTDEHKRTTGLVLSIVTRLTDVFLDDYLRVNASACQS